MAASDYAVAATLKSTLSLSGQTFADADIAAAITSASRAIDNICNRRFYADTSDQTLYFTPTSSHRLFVEDLASITTLKVDFTGDGVFEQTWTADTDYVRYPLNRDTPYRPVQWIERHPLSSVFFPVGYPRTVQIIGKFGWTTTPDDITSACGILATQLLRRARDAPFAESSGDAGRSASTYAFALNSLALSDPHIQLLTGPYVRLPA